MVEAFGKKDKSDKTFTAKVTEICGTKYKVLFCGHTYTVSASIPCSVGDFVRVCAPCNNWQDLYVVENKITKEIVTNDDTTKWNDAYRQMHSHHNRSVLEKISQTLLDNWNAAFSHVSNKSNPHNVTKSQVGLGNVPNVTTNNQTPTYSQATNLANITSGEKLSVTLGKIMKAIADFIVHKADVVIHITASERTKWNDADSKKHTHGNKGVIDKLTQAMLDKLNGIAAGAEVNVQSDWTVTNTASDAYIKNKPATFPPSSHTHDYLPLTGGKITGSLTLNKGYYVHHFAGVGGEPGYVLFAELKITSSYQNTPIMMEILNRGEKRSTVVAIAFANASHSDPVLASMKYSGANLGVYIHKASTSTWNLYFKKSEAYDSATVVKLSIGPYNKMQITWKNTQIAALPTGYITAALYSPASTAVKLSTTRKIGNASFDGTSDITLAQMGVSPVTGSTSLNTLASTITLGDGSTATILQGGATYRQKIEILDDSVAGTDVFRFSQSENSGVSYKALFSITDNGTIKANQFTGNSATATKIQTAHKIGNANFDGTTDITLSAIGAAATGHSHSSFSPTVFSSTAVPDKVGQYCKLATCKIATRFGHVSRTYEVIMGTHGSSNNDHFRLHLWFKQQNEMGASPYVSLTVMDNDSTLQMAKFYATIDELNTAYTQISIYVQMLISYTSCNLFTVAYSNNTSGTVSYYNDSGFINALPGTVIQQKDCTGKHVHAASQITQDADHRFITDYCKSITDWNSATTNGFYMGYSILNAPSTGWYFGRVIAHNANYVYQEVYAFTASTDAKAVPKFIRCKMNGTWGVWTNVTVAKAVPANAKFTDTVYTHPATHPASMITQDSTHRFMTDTERAGLNKLLFSATISLAASGWSGSAPYTQTISVSGVTAAMDILTTLNIPSNATSAQVTAWKKAAGMIDSGTTGNGTVTFKCFSKKPTVNIPLNLKSI